MGSAVVQYMGEVATGDLNVWPVWEQNVIMCGTQQTSVANKLIKDLDLRMTVVLSSFQQHLPPPETHHGCKAQQGLATL